MPESTKSARKGQGERAKDAPAPSYAKKLLTIAKQAQFKTASKSDRKERNRIFNALAEQYREPRVRELCAGVTALGEDFLEAFRVLGRAVTFTLFELETPDVIREVYRTRSIRLDPRSEATTPLGDVKLRQLEQAVARLNASADGSEVPRRPDVSKLIEDAQRRIVQAVEDLKGWHEHPAGGDFTVDEFKEIDSFGKSLERIAVQIQQDLPLPKPKRKAAGRGRRNSDDYSAR